MGVFTPRRQESKRFFSQLNTAFVFLRKITRAMGITIGIRSLETSCFPTHVKHCGWLLFQFLQNGCRIACTAIHVGVVGYSRTARGKRACVMCLPCHGSEGCGVGRNVLYRVAAFQRIFDPESSMMCVHNGPRLRACNVLRIIAVYCCTKPFFVTSARSSPTRSRSPHCTPSWSQGLRKGAPGWYLASSCTPPAVQPVVSY